MLTIRNNTFETNSSSCHSITTMSKVELMHFRANSNDLVIWFPDCEGYSDDAIGHEYKVMTFEEARLQYNESIEQYKIKWEKHQEEWERQDPINRKGKLHCYCENYETLDEDEFYNALNDSTLVHDNITGLYMQYFDYIMQLDPEKCDGNNFVFDVRWWNNE